MAANMFEKSVCTEKNSVSERKINGTVYRIKSVFEGDKNIDDVLLRIAMRNDENEK